MAGEDKDKKAHNVTETDFRRHDTLKDMAGMEQSFYWQRFSAFATLHAGLFVLSTSKAIEGNSTFVEIISLVLAMAWVLVQIKSLTYVDRIKDAYHKERELMGIHFRQTTDTIFDHPRLSATDIGVWVTVAVLLLWLIEIFV